MSTFPRSSKKLGGKHRAAVLSNQGKRPSRASSVMSGINYRPALAALNKLAEWAFDLAYERVEDSPDDRRSISRARRYVLAALRGKPQGRVPYADLDFAADLLVRIFDADLGLGMVDMVSIFDQIGLPTESVPMMPRRQSRAGMPDLPLAPFVVGPTRPHGEPLRTPIVVVPPRAPLEQALAPVVPLRPSYPIGPVGVGAPIGRAMDCGDCPHVQLRRAA